MIFVPRNLLITAAFLLACVFAMGFYVLHLKRQSEEASARIQIQSLAPQASGPQERIPVFIAYDDEGVIREESDSVPEVSEPSERAREILRALLARYLEKPSPHPLGAGSEVKDVYIVNRNLAVVDINGDFANQHRERVRFFKFLQWQISTQAAEVPLAINLWGSELTKDPAVRSRMSLMLGARGPGTRPPPGRARTRAPARAASSDAGCRAGARSRA